jgi:hypothetical protein
MAQSGLCAVALTAIAFGCNGADDSDEIVEPPPACAPGEWQRDDGLCMAPGLPADMPCPPGEWLYDGNCIPAGVPPDGCGEGFVHDGDRGCDAVLPSEPCAPGFMAVPGERQCREVAPCAAGRWGDIPIEADSEHVDAMYGGMDSDGSALKPWTSIQAAINAAAPGAIVAIAAGSYVGDIAINDKALRLWGVCPSLVEIAGTGSGSGTVQLRAGAAGSEVRRVAVRGPSIGVFLNGALDILLERVWLHDNAGRGVNVQTDAAAASVTLDASLVEQSGEFGVVVIGASATLNASVVRNTQPDALGLLGRGIDAQADPATGTPAALHISRSLLEWNHELSVNVSGTEVSVELSVIRDTQPNAAGHAGRAVNARPNTLTLAPSIVSMQNVLVERSHELGISVIGSEATIESSVIRDTRSDATGIFGRGVNAYSFEATDPPSKLVLRTSLVERSQEIGVLAEGAEATVEATVVRDTQPNEQGFFGRGVGVESRPITGAPSTFFLRNSLVERSHEVGLAGSGSTVTVEASVIRDTRLDAQGFGRSVHVESDPITGTAASLLLKSSLVEQSYGAGVTVRGAGGTIESCVVRDVVANGGGFFGDGIIVTGTDVSASASVLATLIDRSQRAAVAAFGAHVAVGGSALTCQALDLDYETRNGTASTLDNLGGNRCGCPEATAECKAVSANLEPPPPLGATPD